MKIREAIILAGGLGTRLQETVPDLPKCLAPIAGRPFISYLLDYFKKGGIEKFIFSLGYKSEAVLEFVKKSLPPSRYDYVVEEEPLGTGGALRYACDKASGNPALVLNGDSFFRIDLSSFTDFHDLHKGSCSLALKKMHNFNRYGLVEIDRDHSILKFKEKKRVDSGLINAGVYILNVESFRKTHFPEKFSFEKDYLEPNAGKHALYGFIDPGYFIDIGIPEDFHKAQSELPLYI